MLRALAREVGKYDITVNEIAPVRVDNVEYPWQLHRGKCSIEVRAVDAAGVQGPPSRIEIEVQENTSGRERET